MPQRLEAADPPDTITLHLPVKSTDVWSVPSHRRHAGQIVQFDSEALVYVDAQGERRSVPSYQVERVSVRWNDPLAVEARALVDGRQYAKAIPKLEAAVKSGIPRWQQRLLIADLVNSLNALGKHRVAGIIFLNLAASDPPLMLYASMPLCWTTREPDAALLAQTKQWFASEDPHARLLAASWLLSGAQRGEAIAELNKLSSSRIQAVALLARLQAWRVVPPDETESRLQGWFRFRDNLPQPLQLGPTEWLAERLEQVGKPELALGQWMRIVSQHVDRYDRWQWAARKAVELMRRLEQDDQAKRLSEWIDEASQ